METCSSCGKKSRNLIYPGRLCKTCSNNLYKERQKQRKANAVRGIVEVRYGIHPEVKKDGGAGYAYKSNGIKLKPGDIVLVPGNWLCPSPQEATVVSTYSDYTGATSSISD